MNTRLQLELALELKKTVYKLGAELHRLLEDSLEVWKKSCAILMELQK